MEIKYIPTAIEGVIIIEPAFAADNRGWFSQLWVAEEFKSKVSPVDFMLENESFSHYGVVRGLHYQLAPYAQGKLVRALSGRILDVAVDARRGSPSFGQHVAVELSEENRRQLYVPRGFAHGFSVLSESARVCYKCDNVYDRKAEVGIRFDDPDLDINWKIPEGKVITSEKDASQPAFSQVTVFDYGEKLY